MVGRHSTSNFISFQGTHPELPTRRGKQDKKLNLGDSSDKKHTRTHTHAHKQALTKLRTGISDAMGETGKMIRTTS